MQFFKTPNIDFISRRKTAYFVSGALLLLSITTLIVRGPNYGIDFKGGTEIAVRFEKNISIRELRETLSESELQDSEIKSFGRSDEYLFYIEQQRGISTSEVTRKIGEEISKAMPDISYEIRKVDTVGPRIGEELRRAAILACFFALILILVYISIRFEFVFSVGAIVALFHDVIITLGIFNLLGYEISLKEIAAFLTIIGYSLNDTIVVYDRIRENLKILRSENLSTIMNKSINQCLSRTVVTSLTTFVVVLVLFLFGGQVIKGFAFAMLVGVVVGTYSSIFVASPVVLEWQSRHGGKRQLRMSKKKK